MFCKFCGNKIDDDAIFCPKCGNRLNAAPTAQIPGNTEPVPAAEITTTRKIHFERLSKLTSALLYVQVYIDDCYVGQLKNGGSFEIEVSTSQQHRIYAISNTTGYMGSTHSVLGQNVGVGTSSVPQSDVVLLAPGTKPVSYNVFFKMGMIVNKICIEEN